MPCLAGVRVLPLEASSAEAQHSACMEQHQGLGKEEMKKLPVPTPSPSPSLVSSSPPGDLCKAKLHVPSPSPSWAPSPPSGCWGAIIPASPTPPAEFLESAESEAPPELPAVMVKENPVSQAPPELPAAMVKENPMSQVFAALLQDVATLTSKHQLELQETLQCHEARLVLSLQEDCHIAQTRTQSAAESQQSKPKSLLQLPHVAVPMTPTHEDFQPTPSVTKALERAEATGLGSFYARSSNIFSGSEGKLPEEPNRTRLIIESRAFEIISGTLILSNALMLGLETHWKVDRIWTALQNGQPVDDQDTTLAHVAGWLFNLCFLVELILRWMADGFLGFFVSADYGWNIMDVVVVFLSLLDQVLSLLELHMPANVSVLRVLRIIRLVKVVRIIRVMKFFRELRIMITSILGSFKALIWVAVVFTLIFYVTCITVMLGVISYLAGTPDAHSAETLTLYEDFGGVGRSFGSLYWAMSGGENWSKYYKTLSVLGTMYEVFFVAYVTFAIFAVVNIVTGVFVDTALQSNKSEMDLIVSEELEQRKDNLFELAMVFRGMTKDGCGRISKENFLQCLANERVAAYLRTMDLDVSNAGRLFDVLDLDSSGEVEVAEFIGGCQRLQGSSTALDAAVTQLEVQNLRKQVKQVLAVVSASAKTLAKTHSNMSLKN